MSKLRKLTRDDFEETMNRLYVYGGPLSEYDFSNHDLRELNIGCYTEKYINCDFSNSDMTGMDMRDISLLDVTSRTQNSIVPISRTQDLNLASSRTQT